MKTQIADIEGNTPQDCRDIESSPYCDPCETGRDNYCDMHQPLEFTPEELQRMDDDRSEREVYMIEASRDDNSNPPEVE